MEIIAEKKIKGGFGQSATHYKHGFTKTKFYYTWVNMQNRCNRPSIEKYQRYGARGIKLKWRDFEDFKSDMYKSYQAHVREFGEKNTQIDRINVDGNYCKKNCRWVTIDEQAKNRSNIRLIEVKGETKTLLEWSQLLNVCYGTLWSRWKRKGIIA